MTKKIAFTAARQPQAQEALKRLKEKYAHVPASKADVIITLGGDGFMLRTLHLYTNSGKAIYGMNRGSVGFLLNSYSENSLKMRINKAVSINVNPLIMRATDIKGKKVLAIAEAIFNGLGTTLIIEESHMQAATVLCASGIAFWMRLIRATTQGGVQLGFDADIALKMSMQTAMGASSLLIETGTHPEEEIDRVTTPRGCTITGLNEMEHQGLSSSLIRGLNASFDKINEIAKQ